MKGEIIYETSCYIHTLECVEQDITTYRLNHRAGRTSWGRFIREGHGCTVYYSKEEAEHDIPHNSMLWNVPKEFFYIEEVREHRIEYKRHRYRKH